MRLHHGQSASGHLVCRGDQPTAHKGLATQKQVTGGFTAKYGVDRLVWYETHTEMGSAILREKQLKAGSRQKKVVLIEAMNPQWDDLYLSLL